MFLFFVFFFFYVGFRRLCGFCILVLYVARYITLSIFFVDVFPCFDFFSNLLVAGLYLVLLWCSLVLFIDFCFGGNVLL